MAEYWLIQTKLGLHNRTDAADLVTGDGLSSFFAQACDFKLQSVRISNAKLQPRLLEQGTWPMAVVIDELLFGQLVDVHRPFVSTEPNRVICWRGSSGRSSKRSNHDRQQRPVRPKWPSR